jgi:hypothetical protein
MERLLSQQFPSTKELFMTSLRQRMIEDMQVRNLSPETQACYVQQDLLFARYFNQSPQALGSEELRAYQVYLTNERRLAPSSILVAVAALRFLYKVTLHKDWTLADGNRHKTHLGLRFDKQVKSSKCYSAFSDHRGGVYTSSRARTT